MTRELGRPLFIMASHTNCASHENVSLRSFQLTSSDKQTSPEKIKLIFGAYLIYDFM